MTMRTNFEGTQYGLIYRPVEIEDAEFIVSLRTDERLGRFLHKTDANIAVQENWIRNYKQREAQCKELYLLFMDESGCKLGVSRIYDIHSDYFVVGSWLFSPDAFVGASILGDIITRQIAFDWLHVETCRFDVRKGNKSVLRYHQSYKPTELEADEENIYFELSKNNFETKKTQYLQFFNKES